MGKALIVEDNPDNLRLMTKILERGGYAVAATSTGTEALQLVANGCFEIVIMDIDLPDMSGLEAARKIRLADNGKTVPIIAVTSYAMRGDMARILEAGCTGYFEKPIDPLTILEEIHKLIRGKA